MMLPMPPDRIRVQAVMPVQWRTTFLMSSSATAASSTAVNTTSSTVRPEKLDHAAP